MTQAIAALYNLFLQHPYISTDTRKILPNGLFFALKGNHFDANQFAFQALEKGAAFAVVDDETLPKHPKLFLVSDVLESLQHLAAHHRQQFDLPILVIGGSNGKTTTKELTAAILAAEYDVLSTKGNLNNHIGVPLTLLGLRKNHQIAVIEIGANHLGEHEQLCRMVSPTLGILTNNGKDHLAGFGSVDQVKKANFEIYNYFKQKKSGLIFVNADNLELTQELASFPSFTFGEKKGDILGKISQSFPFLSLEIVGFKQKINTQLLGEYNFENIMAAIAIGLHFNISEVNISQALSTYQPQLNRSQLILKNGHQIVMDAYNANPSSMELALINFAKMPCINKIAILGDMFELGEFSAQEHAYILQLAQSFNFSILLLIGKNFEKAVQELNIKGKNVFCFTDLLSAQNWLDQQKFENTCFLLKASRSMQLEKLVF